MTCPNITATECDSHGDVSFASDRANASEADEKHHEVHEDESTPRHKKRYREKVAQARRVFVAALSEWVNMHDLHEPFANGHPSADQSCAVEEGGRLYCNKLFPRKILRPGEEELSEDPRRRQLFRLWLARNCHFMNNFVPIVMLAMLSNMDFQATLTKIAVIEYRRLGVWYRSMRPPTGNLTLPLPCVTCRA